MSDTNVDRTQASPPVPHEPGIVIAVPYQTTCRAPLVVRGAFHLPAGEAEAIGHPPQRGVVLLIQRYDYHNACTPFREHALFEDDAHAVPGGVAGFFNIDVFEQQGGPVPGEYQVFVSIGERISNVIDIAVGQ